MLFLRLLLPQFSDIKFLIKHFHWEQLHAYTPVLFVMNFILSKNGGARFSRLSSILRFNVFASSNFTWISNRLNLRMEFLMTNSKCLLSPIICRSSLNIKRFVFKLLLIYLCTLEIVSLRFCIDGSYFIFENLRTFSSRLN